MNLMERISGLFRSAFPAAIKPQQQTLIHTLDAARRANRAEEYDRALEALDKIDQLVDTSGNAAARSALGLQRAEILIRMRRFPEAQALLERLRAENDSFEARLGLGMLAQAQDRWTDAREQYEAALDVARKTKGGAHEGRILGHLAETYLHDGNASYAEHLLRDALPKLSAGSDVEYSTHFVGLLGQALIASGHEVEGQHLLGRALQLAEQMHYRAYERHWSQVMGGRALAEARYPDALVHYEKAQRLSDPQQPSVSYIQLLTQLSKVNLYLRANDQAVSLAEQAVSGAQSLGDVHAEIAARGALGVALRAAGRSSEALAHLQAAVDAEDGETQIEVLRGLAAAYADTDDDAAAIALYGRAIQQAERLGAMLELAQSRRDLGLAHLKRGELAKAIIEWSTALPIYEERKAYAQVARLYVDIGNARKQLGQGQRAMKDFEQALMTLNNVDEADSETRGLVLSSAANAYAEQGDVESADAFYNEAITLSDRLGDRHAEATRFGNYGWFLLLVGRPRRALSMLDRALRLSQALSLPLHAAVQTDNIGLAHDGLGDFASAQEYHEKALTLIAPLDEPRWEAIFRVNLAGTLLSLARADEAEPLLKAALEVGRALEDAEIIVRALTGLASVQLKRRQPAGAESALDEALRMARRMELRRLLAEALAIRSQQLTLLGEHAEATAAWTEAQRLFALLHMPQAKQPPLWLEHPPASA